jgi:YfiH family protein
MRAAATEALLEAAPGCGWRLRHWGWTQIRAGMTDRSSEPAALLAAFGARTAISAEQVHGASVAVIGTQQAHGPVAGADALVTAVPGVALLIRTADCLPVFFADRARRVVGLAHAGWRGLAAGILPRVIVAMQRTAGTPADELRVAIGPGIRECCYEVGADFEAQFGPRVQLRGGRRTCDLTGEAVAQLRDCGVRPERIADTGVCTACDRERWFSLRREGTGTGRLTSMILIRRPRARVLESAMLT